MHPYSLLRVLIATTVSVLIVACGDDGSQGSSTVTDAGADVGSSDDAGVDAREDLGLQDVLDEQGPPPNVHHDSYVPPNGRPAQAARLIVLGDSISAGAGASSSSLRYKSLLLQNDPQWPGEPDLTSVYGDLEVIDVSQGGATTGSVVLGQLPALDREVGDGVSGHSIVVMTIGGNNVQAGLTGGEDNLTGPALDNAIDDLTTIVEFLRDPALFVDGTSIFITNVYDPSDGVGQYDGCFFGLDLDYAVAALDVWDRAYRFLAEELGFAVVDMLGAFHGHGFYAEDTNNEFYDAEDPTLWFANDCIHPNDRGHNEIRRLLFEAIDPSGSYIAD